MLLGSISNFTRKKSFDIKGSLRVAKYLASMKETFQRSNLHSQITLVFPIGVRKEQNGFLEVDQVPYYNVKHFFFPCNPISPGHVMKMFIYSSHLQNALQFSNLFVRVTSLFSSSALFLVCNLLTAHSCTGLFTDLSL